MKFLKTYDLSSRWSTCLVFMALVQLRCTQFLNKVKPRKSWTKLKVLLLLIVLAIQIWLLHGIVQEICYQQYELTNPFQWDQMESLPRWKVA